MTEKEKAMLEILEDSMGRITKKIEKGIYPTPAARKKKTTTREIACIEPKARKKEN